MKILIVGSNLPHAIERYFVKYLSSNNVEVSIFEAPDMALQQANRNLIRKVLHRTNIYTGFKAINTKLIQCVEATKPDIIWVFKGMELFPKTIQLLSQKAVIANYNPDHPFFTNSRGGGNKNVKLNFPFYHIHFCYQKKLVTQINDEFKIKAVHLPFAFDADEVKNSTKEIVEEKIKICFQANPDPHRVDIINAITKAGLEIHVYGHHWQKTSLVHNKKVTIFPIATRDKFWEINKMYRIQLNLFRNHNEGAHNMRTFEIPANGGIQMVPYSEEQENYFIDNKEIIYFKNTKDLIAKAKWILNLPIQQANQIREAAQHRSLHSGYTFKDRATIVYQTFKEFIQNK
jgi:spore maturation protein CgeB